MNKNQIYLEGEQNQRKTKFLFENPEKKLSEFGLSTNQSKVYLYLNQNGSKPASHLSKILEIPRTEIYAILKTLQKKGCIALSDEKPRKFDSIPFEEFLESIINSKKQEIQKLENTLEFIKTLKTAKFEQD